MSMNIMMMILCGSASLVAMLVTAMSTPSVIALAVRIGAIDLPDARKIHHTPVPRLGGLAILAGCSSSFALMALVDPGLFHAFWIASWTSGATAAALLVLLLVGVRDDRRPLPPGVKFLFQLVAAAGCFFAGFRFPLSAIIPSADVASWGDPITFALTLLWIVGVTNGFNLIDGLDGLASGVGALALLGMAILLLHAGDLAASLLGLMVAGALLGFLPFNFNPARIFLGDSGSLFVGLAVSLLSLQCFHDAPGRTMMASQGLLLGLPIVETLLSMTRRYLGSFLPERPANEARWERLHQIFLPDRDHIHHRLLSRGWTQRRAVLTLYMASCALGGCACAVAITTGEGSAMVLTGSVVALFAGIRSLRYRELEIIRNGLLLSLLERPFVDRAGVRILLDGFFCAAAFAISWALKADLLPPGVGRMIFEIVPLACGIQLMILHAGGLHRGALGDGNAGDVMRSVEAVALSVIATALVLILLPIRSVVLSASFFITDFYLLLSLVVGFRFSHHLLRAALRRDDRREPGIRVYPAEKPLVVVSRHPAGDERVQSVRERNRFIGRMPIREYDIRVKVENENVDSPHV